MATPEELIERVEKVRSKARPHAERRTGPYDPAAVEFSSVDVHSSTRSSKRRKRRPPRLPDASDAWWNK